MADKAQNVSSDDAAIFSLNDSGSGMNNAQSEDPFKDGPSAIAQSKVTRHRQKSGAFVPQTQLFNTTPGAKKVQW